MSIQLTKGPSLSISNTFKRVHQVTSLDNPLIRKSSHKTNCSYRTHRACGAKFEADLRSDGVLANEQRFTSNSNAPHQRCRTRCLKCGYPRLSRSSQSCFTLIESPVKVLKFPGDRIGQPSRITGLLRRCHIFRRKGNWKPFRPQWVCSVRLTERRAGRLPSVLIISISAIRAERTSAARTSSTFGNSVGSVRISSSKFLHGTKPTVDPG